MNRLFELVELGGWVVGLQVGMSVIALAVVLWKLWQFHRLGVGRHAALDRAIAAGAPLPSVRAHLVPVLEAAKRADDTARTEAEAEMALGTLESGFRLLDSIAQVAPLLGLYGTVLGMIDAFRALQEAGTAVDPSVLAGGIWVALLTTAVGLAVAMPVQLALTWFDARVARERLWAESALARVRAPVASDAR